MRAVFRAYQYLNILSVDVVVGAIISALFFARLFDIKVKPYGLIALGLTVWIIYTTDHLVDARKIKHEASTARHRFHQRYFRVLLLLLCIAVVIDGFTIIFIRRQVLEGGLILSSIVLLYLLGQQSLRFLKEFFIAFLYTCGVLLLSITVTSISLNGQHYFLIVQFGLIAWTNLVLFSWFDHVFDQRDEQNSLVTMMGKQTALYFLCALFASNFLLTIVQLFMFGYSTPTIVLLGMNLTLFLIFVLRNALAKDDMYRLIGDAIFLLPIFFLLQP